MSRFGGFLMLAIICSCDRAGPERSSTPEADAAESLRSPLDAATTGAIASVHPAQRSTWRGTYRSAIGGLYIPPDWKNVRWSSADTEKGIGEGTLTLEVDPATGGVTGALDGALGPAAVAGVVLEGKLTGTIVRKNPSDRGFTGTLVGAIDDEHGSGGTMNLSSGEAGAIRSATFTLARTGH